MATAAKTAVWVWRPTPGPLRKSKGTLMMLAKLLYQLRPLDQALAEMQFLRGRTKRTRRTAARAVAKAAAYW